MNVSLSDALITVTLLALVALGFLFGVLFRDWQYRRKS